ncbi:uncharacterized protein C8Q71DRAFT_34921 [Rhodofomes roseus]|uniref:Uncharacterized protein n=1 Tax=Rhodofomes roseus TaxID=34475 RepID=A0A4Y9YEE1_9APHY|nr:uncharacterized protein C8Q71DRAFT_34921 [Rhodofomes roseus]KAH9844207.1 hypothetical protein C8Q71DRAFT_34921 [Rhodofomes roseus]TFY59937.1 hypothetical protein EVJ58_g5462 [Rhodofomes roseus]
MSLPSKRVLTEEQRASEPATASNGIDAELAARLRNTASRVRKSVTEGYAPYALGAYNGPRIASKLPFTRSASFQSANDALREAYASHTHNASSNVKRKLTAAEADEDMLEDDDIDLEGEATDLRIPLTSRTPMNHSTRPTKPLPGARRGGMRSLSEGTLPLGGRTNTALIAPGMTIDEEDWSQGSFAPLSVERPQ